MSAGVAEQQVPPVAAIGANADKTILGYYDRHHLSKVVTSNQAPQRSSLARWPEHCQCSAVAPWHPSHSGCRPVFPTSLGVSSGALPNEESH